MNSADAVHPNVVIFLMDNLGYGDPGCCPPQR